MSMVIRPFHRTTNAPAHRGRAYQYSQSELEYINDAVAGGISVEAAIRDMRKYAFRFRQGRYVAPV
jgi:hypothetical protein